VSLEEHLSRFSEGGTHDSVGSFTLDRKKALEKLAACSLQVWTDIFYTLAGWLAHDGTSQVDFDLTDKTLTVRREATGLTRQQLEHLEDYVFAEGKYYGLSLLALTQHLWSSQGRLVIQSRGVKRVWRKGLCQTETSEIGSGVVLEFTHKRSLGVLTQAEKNLRARLLWTPYRWTLDNREALTGDSDPSNLITLNFPPIARHIVPGLTLTKEEYEFHFIVRWSREGSTQVVTDGVAYPLHPPLCVGLDCVIFTQNVRRTVTRSELLDTQIEKEQWNSALEYVFGQFFLRLDLWNKPAFLKANYEQVVTAVWPRLDDRVHYRVARAIVSAAPNDHLRSLLFTRLQLKDGEFSEALNTLSWLRDKRFEDAQAEMARELEEEFVGILRSGVLGSEELEEMEGTLAGLTYLGRNFPYLMSELCLALARYRRQRGDALMAESLYLDSYFLPRCVKYNWHTAPGGASLVNFESKDSPVWTQRISSDDQHLEGLLELIEWAQDRQSSQHQLVRLLREKICRSPKPSLRKIDDLRLECWRLQRRQSQSEWFKWLLMSRRRGWKATFPPRSHDEEYELPPFKPADGPNAGLLVLRCQTVYLEYASLALREAERIQHHVEVVRFSKVITAMREKVGQFGPGDEISHLIELARISIELGELEQAKEVLRSVTSRIPAGHVDRLPLLVDMAILQPKSAGSVLNGVARLMNIPENGIGKSLDLQAQDCTWPVPLDLPSRLRRLAWELSGKEELQAYRIARILYRRAIGQLWHEPTEQNWVFDAISLLEKRRG
jgi:hypothetical protein